MRKAVPPGRAQWGPRKSTFPTMKVGTHVSLYCRSLQARAVSATVAVPYAGPPLVTRLAPKASTSTFTTRVNTALSSSKGGRQRSSQAPTRRAKTAKEEPVRHSGVSSRVSQEFARKTLGSQPPDLPGRLWSSASTTAYTTEGAAALMAKTLPACGPRCLPRMCVAPSIHCGTLTSRWVSSCQAMEPSVSGTSSILDVGPAAGELQLTSIGARLSPFCGTTTTLNTATVPWVGGSTSAQPAMQSWLNVSIVGISCHRGAPASAAHPFATSVSCRPPLFERSRTTKTRARVFGRTVSTVSAGTSLYGPWKRMPPRR
mmetsp:Transcript_14699/g.42044  ORF Transcript_14699/g.42044 Transcript_14699/m.42044 type:complete len:315 (+) Transcript_14699:557-1501(+)